MGCGYLLLRFAVARGLIVNEYNQGLSRFLKTQWMASKQSVHLYTLFNNHCLASRYVKMGWGELVDWGYIDLGSYPDGWMEMN